MMSDYFFSCERLYAEYSASGLGDLHTSFTEGETVRGIVLPASKKEATRGADGAVNAHRSVFHTFKAYGLKHNDYIRYRGTIYRLVSESIPAPERAVDSGWESFFCEEVLV